MHGEIIGAISRSSNFVSCEDEVNASVFTENYVTPDKTIGCSSNQSQNCCLTLQEYASRPDVYFTNDTIFYFEPGEHKLNSSLKLENLNNVTLQGLPAEIK